MKKNFFTLIHIVLATQLFAQTYLPSTLCNDTLKINESPFIANSTITINQGCALRVNPGVEIQMGENTYLIIKGSVDFAGTASQPISVHAKDSTWGIIYLDSTGTEKSTFNYVTIENATEGVYGNNHNDSVFQQAAFSCFNSAVELNHCVFKNNRISLYCYYCKNISIKNCLFDSTNTGEKIHGERSEGALVDSSVFFYTWGSGDAIDFDGSKNITISNNRFYGGESDAIDIGNSADVGCDGVNITKNFIYGMGDKGISCGELSTSIMADYNVIVACDKGIVSKQGSQVFADHNTLYGNRIGIMSTDYQDSLGPGNISVFNSIIASSIDSTWAAYFTSILNISYSLSDMEIIPGTGNVYNDPMFVLPAMDLSGDFHLTSGSGAIDMGDPVFTPDSDGSRTDIGAFFYDKAAFVPYKNKIAGGIFIYPNPVKQANSIYLSAEAFRSINETGLEQMTLTIHDIFGRELSEINLTPAKSKIPMGSLSPGIYFVRIKNGTSIIGNEKMVVE